MQSSVKSVRVRDLNALPTGRRVFAAAVNQSDMQGAPATELKAVPDGAAIVDGPAANFNSIIGGDFGNCGPGLTARICPAIMTIGVTIGFS
jgi:hypothetical protein